MTNRRKPRFCFRVGLGACGVALKYYYVRASSSREAQSFVLRNFTNTETGPFYDYIEAVRVPKERAQKIEVYEA